jgi:hypothetical protein
MCSDDVASTFHEIQVGRQCALHAVNNMLQYQAYTAESFTEMSAEIAYQRELVEAGTRRTWLHVLLQLPDKLIPSPFQSKKEDWDVQVMDLALQKQGFDLCWFDDRKGLDDLTLRDPALEGLILNMHTVKSKMCGQMKSSDRHWLCIKRTASGVFVNLDSRIRSVEVLGDANDVVTWLESNASPNQRNVIFRVTRQKISKISSVSNLDDESTTDSSTSANKYDDMIFDKDCRFFG